MRQIIAIGGGGFSMEPENLAFEQYMISLTGKANPSVCFIPTASADSEDYIAKFYSAYESLGCTTSHLSLFWPSRLDFEVLMGEQDLIFVGGGNTRNLLTLWRDWELDRAIRKAYEKGTILAGVSAGANCWFEEFSTDSMGPLAPWKGLGWLKGSFCPHYDGEVDRKPSLRRMLDKGELGSGFAADDGAAVHFIDEQVHRCIRSRPNARVYRVGEGPDIELETFEA